MKKAFPLPMLMYAYEFQPSRRRHSLLVARQVHMVRGLRHELAMLQTDHKQVNRIRSQRLFAVRHSLLLF